jgi:hypothetical protein
MKLSNSKIVMVIKGLVKHTDNHKLFTTANRIKAKRRREYINLGKMNILDILEKDQVII